MAATTTETTRKTESSHRIRRTGIRQSATRINDRCPGYANDIV